MYIPLTRRSGVWFGFGLIYEIRLAGAAAVSIDASGRVIPQFKGAATIIVAGNATLTQTALSGTVALLVAGNATLTQTTMAGAETLALTGAGTLTQSALNGAATASLSLYSDTTIFRGLIIDPPVYSRRVFRGYVLKEGFTDLEVPISNFQSRRTNKGPAYLTMTVPNPGPYLDALEARLGGQLVIKAGFVDFNHVEILTELERADWDSFRYDLGAQSGSATLSGHRDAQVRVAIERRLQGVSYKSVTDGLIRFRCLPDMYLMPGDWVEWRDDFIPVGSITHTVNPTQATMEIEEAKRVTIWFDTLPDGWVVPPDADAGWSIAYQWGGWNIKPEETGVGEIAAIQFSDQFAHGTISINLDMRIPHPYTPDGSESANIFRVFVDEVEKFSHAGIYPLGEPIIEIPITFGLHTVKFTFEKGSATSKLTAWISLVVYYLMA